MRVRSASRTSNTGDHLGYAAEVLAPRRNAGARRSGPRVVFCVGPWPRRVLTGAGRGPGHSIFCDERGRASGGSATSNRFNAVARSPNPASTGGREPPFNQSEIVDRARAVVPSGTYPFRKSRAGGGTAFPSASNRASRSCRSFGFSSYQARSDSSVIVTSTSALPTSAWQPSRE